MLLVGMLTCELHNVVIESPFTFPLSAFSNSIWNISLQLKYVGEPHGHVLTVRSLEGHRISLSLDRNSRTVVLSIYQPIGDSNDPLKFQGLPVVEPNTFFKVVYIYKIKCDPSFRRLATYSITLLPPLTCGGKCVGRFSTI